MTAYGFINFWLNFWGCSYKDYIAVLSSGAAPFLAWILPSAFGTTETLGTHSWNTKAAGQRYFVLAKSKQSTFPSTGQDFRVKEKPELAPVPKAHLHHNSHDTMLEPRQVSLP